MEGGNPAPSPLDTLEVRWFVRGELGMAMREWFARFPAGTEKREDAYLLQPRLRGLSVKLRDGGALDVKSYLGSGGVLDLPHGGRGHLECWRKWSFPYTALGQEDAAAMGWVVVRKTRRSNWFPLAAGGEAAPVPERADQAGCAAEVTEARVAGESWWSVGLEATGPAGLLRGALQHAVGLVFAQPLPPRVELSLDNSRSYAQWLCHRLPLGRSAAARPAVNAYPLAYRRRTGNLTRP